MSRHFARTRRRRLTALVVAAGVVLSASDNDRTTEP